MSTRSGGRRSVASMAAEISDSDLRARLREYGLAVGPVTATTRGVMLRKLEALQAGNAKPKAAGGGGTGIAVSSSSSGGSSSSSGGGKVIRTRVVVGGGGGGERVATALFSSDSEDDERDAGGRGGRGLGGGGQVRSSSAPKRDSLGAGVVPGLSRPYQRATATRDVGTDPRKKTVAFRKEEIYSDDDSDSRRGGGSRGYERYGGGDVNFNGGAEEEEEEEVEDMDTRDDRYSGGAAVSGGFQSEFARHLEAGGGYAVPPKPSASASSALYGNERRSGLDMNYPSYYSSSTSSSSYSSTAAAAAPSFSSPTRSLLTSRYSSDLGGLRGEPIATSSSSSGLRQRDALGDGDGGGRRIAAGAGGGRIGDGGGGGGGRTVGGAGGGRSGGGGAGGGRSGGGDGYQSYEPQDLDKTRRDRFPYLSTGRADDPGQSSTTAPSLSTYWTSPSSWFTSRGGGGGGGGGGVGGGGKGVGGDGGGRSSVAAGSRDSPPFASSSRLNPRQNYTSYLQPSGGAGGGRGLGGGSSSSSSSSFSAGPSRAEAGGYQPYDRGAGAGAAAAAAAEGRVEARRAPLVSSSVALRKRGGAAAAAAKQAAGDHHRAADSFFSRYKSNLLRIGLGILLVWVAIVYLMTCGQDSDEFQAPCQTKDCERQGVDEICGKIHSLLAVRAGEHVCGHLTNQQAELPVEKVKMDPEIKNYGDGVFNQALAVIVKNGAGFGIKARGADPHATVVNASQVKFLESLHPHRSFLCRLRFAVFQTVVRLLLIFLAIAVLWGLFLYAKLWFRQREERKKQVFEIVEKISDMLQQQLLDSQTNWRVEPYLPIPHVRDSLIKPQDRDRMRTVWEQAVQFIDAGESRISTENQVLHGQDCEVWRWTCSPASPVQSPAASPASRP